MSKKRHLREFQASYKVDAEVPSATGVTAAPPGGSQSAGDKAGPPSTGQNAPKGKAELISAMVDKYKDMDDKDLQDAFDQLNTPPDKDVDDSEADSKSKTADIKNEENGDEDEDGDDFDFDFDDKEQDEEADPKSDEDEKEKDEVKEGKLPAALKKYQFGKKKLKEADEADDDKKDDDEDKEEVKEGEQPPWLKKDGDKKDDDKEDVKEEDESEDDEDEKDDEKKDTAESFKITRKDLNLGEDVQAIFKGSNLTEEFKSKATELFEAAVISKVNSQAKRVKRLVEADVKKRATGKLKKLAERLDTYLNYVVEQWMKDNAVAIESGLQREIVEEFIGGLHRLFNEHYIAVPSAKEEIVEKLTLQNEELRNSLNEEIKRGADTKAKIDEASRKAIIKNATSKLTEVQAARIQQIAEALVYTTPEEFAGKMKDLTEAYSVTEKPKPGVRTLEEGNELEADVEVSAQGSIAAYANRISRDVQK